MKRLRDSMEVISGVYEIENIVNGNKYVGSSKDIYERWLQHRRDLNKGEHCNNHLQSAWNIYKENNFIFRILEVTPDTKEDRFNREQYWYDFYKDNGVVLYNESSIVICPNHVSTLDDIKNDKRRTSYNQFIKICDLLKNTNMSFEEISKETGMCASHIYNIYSRRYYDDLTKGMEFIERKIITGTRINAKLSEEQVRNIIQDMLDGAYNIDLSKKYCVSPATIEDIKCHRTWRDLTDGINFEINRKTGGNSKPILQYDLNGNFISEYVSAREAEVKTGISYKLISKVCKGERSQTHGFIFKFK